MTKFFKKLLTKPHSPSIMHFALGRLAQLARASAWRAEGHRFESYIVHQTENHTIRCGFSFWYGRWRTRTHLNGSVRWTLPETSVYAGFYLNFLPPDRKCNSSPISSTILEKSELIPNRERVRIFCLYQRHSILRIDPGGPLFFGFFMTIYQKQFSTKIKTVLNSYCTSKMNTRRFNSKAFSRETLQMLWKQKYLDIQIVVVFNNN